MEGDNRTFSLKHQFGRCKQLLLRQRGRKRIITRIKRKPKNSQKDFGSQNKSSWSVTVRDRPVTATPKVP